MALAEHLPKARMMRSTRILRDEIPYTVPVQPDLLKTVSGDFVRVWHLAGFPCQPHPAVISEKLDDAFVKLMDFYGEKPDPHVAYWVYLDRRQLRPDEVYPGPALEGGFEGALDRRYREKTQFYANDYYFALVYSPLLIPGGETLRWAKSTATDRLLDDDLLMLKIDARSRVIEERLAAYGITRLGVYADPAYPDSEAVAAARAKGIAVKEYSSLYEFLGRLINGEDRMIPFVTDTEDIRQALLWSHLDFPARPGRIESIGLRGMRKTAALAALGYKDEKWHDVFDSLLALPFEFSMALSFKYLSEATAEAKAIRKVAHLVQTGDRGVSQQEAVEDEMLDELTSQKVSFGDSNLHFFVPGENEREVTDYSVALEAAIGHGCTIVREEEGTEHAFWAKLPGNFRYRPRPTMVSTENFAVLMPFHGTPAGKKTGNHWGNAIAALPTLQSTPYYLNFHQRDLGHTSIVGQSGSGKDVFMGWVFALLRDADVTAICLDTGNGGEPFIRMIGTYHDLHVGRPTGFLPFVWDESRDHLLDPETLRAVKMERRFDAQEFVRGLVTRPSETLSTQRRDNINTAVAALLDLPSVLRRLRALHNFLTDASDPDGIDARLRQWTVDRNGEPGPYAWVFDAPATDGKPYPVFDKRMTGFNVSEKILRNPELCPHIAKFIFMRMKELYDGRRIAVVVNEFDQYLADDYFVREFGTDLPGARKANRIIIPMTQSPHRTAISKIGHQIRENTATRIFLANPNAGRDDYMNGFGVSEEIYDVIRSLSAQKHDILIQQSDHWCVVRLPLDGYSEIPILSGRSDNVAILHEIIAEVGDNPDDWVPLYMKRSNR